MLGWVQVLFVSRSHEKQASANEPAYDESCFGHPNGRELAPINFRNYTLKYYDPLCILIRLRKARPELKRRWRALTKKRRLGGCALCKQFCFCFARNVINADTSCWPSEDFAMSGEHRLNYCSNAPKMILHTNLNKNTKRNMSQMIDFSNTSDDAWIKRNA